MTGRAHAPQDGKYVLFTLSWHRTLQHAHCGRVTNASAFMPSSTDLSIFPTTLGSAVGNKLGKGPF